MSSCFRAHARADAETIMWLLQVYSPHTAVDAATNGLGDWLADIITAIPTASPEQENDSQLRKDGDTSTYGLTYLSPDANSKIKNLKL